MVIGPLTPPTEIYPRPDWRIKRPEDPSFMKVLASSFRQYNPVFSLNTTLRNFSNIYAGLTYGPPPEDYDPMKDVPDDLIEFADSFLWDRNPQDVANTTAALRQSLEDFEIMNKSGWTGTGTAIAASIADPIQFMIPSSFFFKAIKGGTILARLGKGAAFGVGATLASEPFLQMGVPSRTAAQTGQELLSAGILTGILGAAFGRNLSAAAKLTPEAPLLLTYDPSVGKAIKQSKKILSNIMFTNSLKYNQRWHPIQIKGINILQDKMAGLIKERELLTNPYTHNAKSLDRLKFRKLSNQINDLQQQMQQITPEFPESLNINFRKYPTNAPKLLNDRLDELWSSYSQLPTLHLQNTRGYNNLIKEFGLLKSKVKNNPLHSDAALWSGRMQTIIEELKGKWQEVGTEDLPSFQAKQIIQHIQNTQNELLLAFPSTQAVKRTVPQDILEIKNVMGLNKSASIPETLKVNIGRIENINTKITSIFQKTKGILYEKEAKEINALLEERDFLYEMRRTFLSDERVFTENVKGAIKKTMRELKALNKKRADLVTRGAPLSEIQEVGRTITESSNDLRYLQKTIYPGEIPAELAKFNPEPMITINRHGYEYDIPGWIFEEGNYIYNSEGEWLSKTVDELRIAEKTAEIDSILDSIGETMRFEPSKYSDELGETIWDLYQKELQIQKLYPERLNKPKINFKQTARVKAITPQPVPESKLIVKKQRIPIITKLEPAPEGSLKVEGKIPKPKKPRKKKT